jgi:hypothetical protein
MGVLVAAESVGIGCAGWVLRAIVGEVSGVLQEQGYSELAAWLTDELSPSTLFSHLDARGLKPEFQEVFLAAIVPAYRRAVQRGPEGWHDPSFWEGYERLFASLAAQAEMFAHGRSPTEWPNLNGIGAHDGSRDGPGWSQGEGGA